MKETRVYVYRVGRLSYAIVENNEDESFKVFKAVRGQWVYTAIKAETFSGACAEILRDLSGGFLPYDDLSEVLP